MYTDKSTKKGETQPCAIKRWPKAYPLLTEFRNEASEGINLKDFFIK